MERMVFICRRGGRRRPCVFGLPIDFPLSNRSDEMETRDLAQIFLGSLRALKGSLAAGECVVGPVAVEIAEHLQIATNRCKPAGRATLGHEHSPESSRVWAVCALRCKHDWQNCDSSLSALHHEQGSRSRIASHPGESSSDGAVTCRYRRIETDQQTARSDGGRVSTIRASPRRTMPHYCSCVPVLLPSYQRSSSP
jgi:hypothetical protein